MKEMEATSSPEQFDLHTFESRLSELEQVLVNHEDDDVMLNQSIEDCALQVEGKLQQIVSDCSDFGSFNDKDLDEYLEHLREELKAAEAKTCKISNEIELLCRLNVDDSETLRRDVEQMKYLLDFMSLQGIHGAKNAAGSGGFSHEDQSTLSKAHVNQQLEMMELDNEIEDHKMILKSLKDLDFIFKRFDAVEKIEDALSDLKVIDYDGSCIRLSMQTYIPKLEDIFQNIEDIAEPFEVNHELLIDVKDEYMELQNVEIFPNDIYMVEIVEAAKSRRQSFPHTRPALEWFVRKVQDRIVQCTLRQLAVKRASKSGHAFEYLDKEETIIAHITGGVDAYIKVSQGWPLINSPLKLLSLKRSKFHQNEFSSGLLHKVEEMQENLDASVLHSLCSFVDAIEKMLSKEI